MIGEIQIPDKLAPVFAEPLGTYDYRWMYGGRGSGKSATAATVAACWGVMQPLRVLCCREVQKSLQESLFAEIVAGIQRTPWLDAQYEIGQQYIRTKNGRSEFLFAGLKKGTTSSIKSMSKIGLVLVEEAEQVSEQSWLDLTGTIREPGSEIWAVWNPKARNSPVDSRFRQSPPERGIGAEINYVDNPWFSDRLRRQMEYDKKRDYTFYRHQWLGDYLEIGEAQVFKNWRVEEFDTPSNAHLRFGADWGFATDPTAVVRCFLDGRTLYIDHEAYMVGCEIVNTPDLFLTIPAIEKWPIIADSSRPETISHMRKHGFPRIMPAVKGAKSVEDGVSYLQGLDIVVHPRCKQMAAELSAYRYKTDESGNLLPILMDEHNHLIDALRYAVEGARRAPASRPVSIEIPRGPSWH